VRRNPRRAAARPDPHPISPGEARAGLDARRARNGDARRRRPDGFRRATAEELIPIPLTKGPSLTRWEPRRRWATPSRTAPEKTWAASSHAEVIAIEPEKERDRQGGVAIAIRIASNMCETEFFSSAAGRAFAQSGPSRSPSILPIVWRAEHGRVG